MLGIGPGLSGGQVPLLGIVPGILGMPQCWGFTRDSGGLAPIQILTDMHWCCACRVSCSSSSGDLTRDSGGLAPMLEIVPHILTDMHQ